MQFDPSNISNYNFFIPTLPKCLLIQVWLLAVTITGFIRRVKLLSLACKNFFGLINVFKNNFPLDGQTKYKIMLTCTVGQFTQCLAMNKTPG